ncbi:bifunctional riboflavin kinase/FAD synthetase [[Limnothrix rosea] IAM M-220]|uniref:bifunctional riboflavin kinase/FAD synthetase n=1 Tax=[Limnothrix rosea] IAM M-220 TaxID=454133 RepID=UPI00095F6AD7|nr:bifunctional riboflavin kinase/FAD synthetase [[Limnothrix rosea] IAM M-220]OKH11518.1 riboflavin biosynthesis protein RibF [[Limnothrix rosea] IAM M-220]
MRVVSSTIEAVTPTSIALGNFDGIHRGHQRVIEPAIAFTRHNHQVVAAGNHPTEQPPQSPRLCPTVVTFDPHPREFFSGNPKRLLTPLPEKVAVLAQLGIEQLVLLPFDRELAALTPEEFISEILVKKLKTRSISIGVDFCFGRSRSGNSTDLKAIAAGYDVEVNIAPLYKDQGDRISSSAIRKALVEGQLTTANALLGRAYTLQGKVIHGQKLGRKLGFPTANLELSATKFLPKYGVYGVQVNIQSSGQNQWGILNLGCRPTVEPNAKNPTIEVHLFDYDQHIYGETLTVKLLHYLRPEQKFDSLQKLQAQIHTDCARTKKLLNLP